MRFHAVSLASALLLCGCATTALPPAAVPEPLFADARFAPPSQPVDADAAFALSEPMRRFLEGELRQRVRQSGPRMGLYRALREDLQLHYDAAATRTAAEAFEARAGNCLSLVMLTAAFARQLDIPVRYQQVFGQETWSRAGGAAVLSTHVNVTLEAPLQRRSRSLREEAPLTLDFLPSRDVAHLPSQPLDEATVKAMYLNNRAAEHLLDGRLDEAYWWARAAIRLEPGYTGAYNTLAVVYRRHGDPDHAQAVLNHALLREPENPQLLSNLAEVYAQRGLHAEAEATARRLARIAPYPPFHFYELGRAALGRGDVRAALAAFRRELVRMPYDHELHFAIALASLQLGETTRAVRHMDLAMKSSTTPERQHLYAAKLERLQSQIH